MQRIFEYHENYVFVIFTINVKIFLYISRKYPTILGNLKPV
jgi:hypothetical protein